MCIRDRFRKVLEENGIQFVIDDFGTGYSNLHCISDMNPGYVKTVSYTHLMECDDTGIGGMKSVTFMITGAGAYSVMKYESGVHLSLIHISGSGNHFFRFQQLLHRLPLQRPA